MGGPGSAGIIEALNREIPYFLRAQSSRGDSGEGWTMEVVRWRENIRTREGTGISNASTPGMVVQYAPDLHNALASRLSGRSDFVCHWDNAPDGTRPPFTFHRSWKA